MLIHNGSLPGLEHLPWGLDCNWFGCPFLEIFLVRASLTLTFRCGGDKKRKIKKSSSAACCCGENAFPVISQTSNRALPLPVNPFHHRPPQKDRSFRKTFARVMLTPAPVFPPWWVRRMESRWTWNWAIVLALSFLLMKCLWPLPPVDGCGHKHATLTMLKKQPQTGERHYKTDQEVPWNCPAITWILLASYCALIWGLSRVGGVWGGAGLQSKREVV